MGSVVAHFTLIKDDPDIADGVVTADAETATEAPPSARRATRCGVVLDLDIREAGVQITCEKDASSKEWGAVPEDDRVAHGKAARRVHSEPAAQIARVIVRDLELRQVNVGAVCA